MKINKYLYDPEDDVLFISFGKYKKLYGDIDKYNIVQFYNEEGKLVALEILDFNRLYESGNLKSFILKEISNLKWKEIEKVYKKIVNEIPKSISNRV